jgi:hypothetical protein
MVVLRLVTKIAMKIRMRAMKVMLTLLALGGLTMELLLKIALGRW